MANKIVNSIKNMFNVPLRPAGNILAGNAEQSISGYRPVVDQELVKVTEPFGTKVPKQILNRASGWSQLANLSHEFTIEKVQSALRQAEFGDTRMLFGFYRDFFLGSGMVASELGKRKLSTIAEPYTVLPSDKTNKDDVVAAKVIAEALDRCPQFNRSLVHLMNAIVFPVSVLEKTFDVIDDDYGVNQYNLRYRIKQLYPVDYNLLTYRLPYIPQGPINIGNQPVMPVPPLTQNLTGRAEDTIFDPDSWEPDLRFWSVFNNGLINFAYPYMMAPDPDRHIVYRCNLLEGIARENWGGLGRSILWYAIMSQLGLDKFLQCLQRYGMPFIVAKVDTSQVDTVDKVLLALADSHIINAIAVNKDAVVELTEMNYSSAAQAHTSFLEFCQNQIALLISGQTLGTTVKSTGLGSGTSNLHADIRESVIKWDRLCLNSILREQLFKQYLAINMIPGATPNIVWGGSSTPEECLTISSTIQNLANAGFTVDDSSLDDLSTKLGMKIERAQLPTLDENGMPVENNSGKSDKDKNLKDTKKDGKVQEPKNKPSSNYPTVAAQKVIESKLGQSATGHQKVKVADQNAN